MKKEAEHTHIITAPREFPRISGLQKFIEIPLCGTNSQLASLVRNYTGTRLSKQTQDLILTIANREIIQLVSVKYYMLSKQTQEIDSN